MANRAKTPPSPTAGLQTRSVVARPDWDQPVPGGRHHIFLFDGTWNDETGDNIPGYRWDAEQRLWVSAADPTLTLAPVVTNIAKTYRTLAADGATQVTHYFRGVGNDDDNPGAEQFLEGAFGLNERPIRRQAYAEFVQHYRRGDTLSILGFSRGAASARMFANDLRTFGLLTNLLADERLVRNRATGRQERELWALYRNRAKTLVAGDALDLLFLGCFDTVGAFGIPQDIAGLPFGALNFGKDLSLDSGPRYAVHAVALDETRKAFEPVLMEHAAGAPDRKEVWFTGVHSDIGGGFFESALSRLTLGFMWANWDAAVAAAGALPPLAWDAEARALQLATAGLPWVLHENARIWERLGQQPRSCRVLNAGPVRVHPSVETFVQENTLVFLPSAPANALPKPIIYEPTAALPVGDVRYDRTEWPA